MMAKSQEKVVDTAQAWDGVRGRALLTLAIPGVAIHQSSFYVVERLFGDRILRVVRSARPFVSAESVDKACEPVQSVLDRAGRGDFAVLIDSRAVAGRNDPSSELTFARHRRRMVQGFRRAAVLLATATGKLQTERLIRQDATSGHTRTFLSEVEAVAHLEPAATV